MRIEYDVIVVGGGPAGLAATCSAKEAGAEHVLVLEGDKEAGGILNQYIHNGFSLYYFKEELTGPEYAARFVEQAEKLGVEICLNTMVLATQEHVVTAYSVRESLVYLKGKAIALAMGCRKRTRGAVAIPGDGPSGAFTAGTAQRYINIEGWMVGRRVVILGNGDIGLIMARRMTLEGTKVLACVESIPYCSGLNQNIVQCLDDYGIPLYLSHTVTNVEGLQKVERVTVAQMGLDRKPIAGTEMVFDRDTLLLSVGLIPENELTIKAGIPIDNATRGALVYENMETQEPGVFSCGDVVHVHDLVDSVTVESQKARKAAARYAMKRSCPEGGRVITVDDGNHVTYTVPQAIRMDSVGNKLEISFRINSVLRDVETHVKDGEKLIVKFRREHMASGEMGHVTAPNVLLNKVEDDEIIVSVELQKEV